MPSLRASGLDIADYMTGVALGIVGSVGWRLFTGGTI